MNSKIGKMALKFGFLFLALVALVGGLVIPASAAPSATPNSAAFQMLQGEVQSVAAPSLVVLEANKQVVTLATDSNTQYFIPDYA